MPSNHLNTPMIHGRGLLIFCRSEQPKGLLAFHGSFDAPDGPKAAKDQFRQNITTHEGVAKILASQ